MRQTLDDFVKTKKESTAPKRESLNEFIGKKEEKKYVENQKKFGAVSVDPTKSPVMKSIDEFVKNQPPKEPTWNGVIDNPIGRTVGKGLGVLGEAYDKISHLPVINQATGLLQGAVEPFVRNDKQTVDEPLWKKLAGNVKDAAHIGQMITNPSLVVTDLFKNKSYKDAAKSFVEAPVNAVKGALHPDEARKKLEDSLKSKSLVTKLAVGSLADPLSYVPLPSIRGIKGASSAIGETFDKMFGRVKPVEVAPAANPILALPAAKRADEISRMPFQERIQYTDDLQSKAKQQALLGEGDFTPPTRLKVNNPTETLDYVMTKIKPQVMEIIEAPARRDLLVQYIQKNTGYEMSDIINRPMNELQELGQVIQKDLHGNMQQIAFDVAKQQGHDLPALLENQAPNLRAQLARDKQSQVYGVQPPKVGIQKPSFNVRHESQALSAKETYKFGENINKGRAVGDKPKAAPANGTVTPKETVQQPTLKEAAAKTEPIVGKPAELKPKAEVKPRVVTPGIRANYRNQLNNGNLSPELKAKIKASDQSYEKITNKASDDIAKESVKNLSKAESDFLLNQTGGPDHIATGYRLQQKLDALGLTERALIVSHKLAKDLTKSGQTTQAASIIARLSPEGQLLNLTRTAIKNNKTVSVADREAFKEQAKIVKDKVGAGVRANQFTEILDRAAKGEKLTPDDVKVMSDYLANAEKTIKPKVVKVVDDLPEEMKIPRKRDKIISYLDDAEQAALARIKARKNNLNSLPLAEWGDHAIVVAAQIAKGSIKGATHIEDLVKLFGEEIRPVATQVFQKAQGLVKRVSPSVGEGNLAKANQAFRRLSGEAEKEKAAVQEMALHVKKLIADSKAGKLDEKDIQKLRDYSDEIAEMTADVKPRELPTQDQRFLQSVKALSKKIAQVETEKIPMDQANKEISTLLRQITKISEEGTEQALRAKVDNTHLSNIAHDVMNKTRPTPKPTTLQEKIVEKYLNQQVKEGVAVSAKDIATLRDLAKNITRLSADSRIDADIAMQKILNSYEKSNAWDKVLAIRYISMLLNTGTQAVNAVSGPLMATTGAAVDVLGTMVDIAMHTTLKTPRSTTMYGTNPLKFIARYMKSLKVGGKAGAQGVNPAGIQSTNEIRGLAFPNLKNPLTFIPSVAERTLGAVAKGADYAAYKSVYDSEIVKQGFLDAINSGIKRSDKAAIKSHVEKFVNEPTEKAMLEADRIGKNTTFQRSDSTGGKIANYVNTSPTLIKPFINAIVPFVRTPINIASTAVTLTPAGILKGLFQLMPTIKGESKIVKGINAITSKSTASQREAIRNLSLGITGSAGIGSLGYYLSQIGIITGANDSGDKNVDAIREQAGMGKYRFNQSALGRYMNALLDGEGSEAAENAAKYQEGDHAFDYNKFQPLAFPLAIGASLGKTKGKPLAGRLETAGAEAYGSLFGMSTLKGVQNIFQPTYGGTQGERSLGPLKRVEEAFLKSFSWGGLAQEARRQDPIQRKTPFNDGVIANTKDYFKSRIPGMSQSLPALKTTLGLDKTNAPGIMGQYVNPYKSEVAAYSSAAVLISELIDRTGDFSVAPSAPEKKVLVKNKLGEKVSVAIPQDRYEQLQEEVGHNIIIKIMALNPSLSDLKKVEKIKDIYESVRKKEMDKVAKELKSLAN